MTSVILQVQILHSDTLMTLIVFLSFVVPKYHDAFVKLFDAVIILTFFLFVFFVFFYM